MQATHIRLSLLLILVALPGSEGSACSFFGELRTFSQFDPLVAAKWVAAEKATETSEGSTRVEIAKIFRDTRNAAGTGKTMTLPRHISGKPGDLLLVTRTAEQAGWVRCTDSEITHALLDYLANSPDHAQPPAARLKYFVNYLEHPDFLVAYDAWAEFRIANYRDIKAIATVLPREKLRVWLSDPKLSRSRLGCCGMLLGLCGQTQDAELLEKIIFAKTKEFRVGADGLMVGYLTLTGEAGLKRLAEAKLEDPKQPFSEVFSAMCAMEMLWKYGDGAVPRPALQKAMRNLLGRTDVVDLVINALARWKDWENQGTIITLYDAPEFNIPAFKRAIIRYLLASAADGAKEPGQPEPPHVAAAKKALDNLRQRDPKTVELVEKYCKPADVIDP